MQQTRGAQAFSPGNVVRMENYLPMIRMLARRSYTEMPEIAKRWIQLEDLEQEGRLAAITAMPRLDRSRSRASTFFYTAVTNYFRNKKASLVCSKRLTIIVPLDDSMQDSWVDSTLPVQPSVAEFEKAFERLFKASDREVRLLCMLLLSGVRGVPFTPEASQRFKDAADALKLSLDDCNLLLQDEDARMRLKYKLCNRAAMEGKQCLIQQRCSSAGSALKSSQNRTARLGTSSQRH